MSWELLAGAVRTRLTSDTGSGGLFNASSAALITAVYFVEGAQETATFPYIVLIPISQNENHVFDATPRAVFYGIQVSIFTTRQTGMSQMQAISDRIRTRLHRWAPTITDWIPDQLTHESTQGPFFEERSLHQVDDYQAFMAKVT